MFCCCFVDVVVVGVVGGGDGVDIGAYSGCLVNAVVGGSVGGGGGDGVDKVNGDCIGA